MNHIIFHFQCKQVCIDWQLVCSLLVMQSKSSKLYIHFVVSSLREKNFECPEVMGTLYYACLRYLMKEETPYLLVKQKTSSTFNFWVLPGYVYLFFFFF